MELRGMRAIKNLETGHHDIFTPPCGYLSPEGKCIVQETKPILCRRFEVGGLACGVMRKLWYAPSK